MKRLIELCSIASIILLVAGCTGKKEYEKVISTYPDGKKQLVYVMKGKEDKAVKTVEKMYYSNGKLQYEKHFSGKDEHLDGECKYYYPTGEVFATGDYSNNHTTGSDWKLMDRDGGLYLSGEYDSLTIAEYSEIGTPATVVFHKKNTDVFYQFYSNCMLRSTGKLIDGKREGRWIFYHPNGIMQTDATFTSGKENGKYSVYRDNGIPYYQGLYENGKRCGEWEFYDTEGNVMQRQKFN